MIAALLVGCTTAPTTKDDTPPGSTAIDDDTVGDADADADADTDSDTDTDADADTGPVEPVDLDCLEDDPTLTALERSLIELPADSWTTVPGSSFGAYCADHALDEPGYGTSRCVNLIDAWGGGVFDDGERRMVLFGGGHNDYSGNQVYGFDLASGAWTVLREATPADQITPSQDPYADGSPASRHSYDGFAYLPDLRRWFVFGGSRYQDGSSTPTAWLFDSAAGTWERRADFDGNQVAGLFYTGTAYDEATGTVITRTESGLYSYDVAADAWTTRADFGYPPFWPTWSTYSYRRGVVVPSRRWFVGLGGALEDGSPDVMMFDLDTWADATVPTTGDADAVRGNGPGSDYDPADDAIVSWSGGAPGILDLDTLVWRAGSADGAPSDAVGNGTYGRWRYVAYLNVFVLVNHPEDDVHFYKNTAGCGVAR
ncbi:MAG: hypothetical protein ABMB14_11460 [Myxococcota bacterium]